MFYNYMFFLAKKIKPVIYRPLLGPDMVILAFGHFHDLGQVSPYPDLTAGYNIYKLHEN